MDEESGTAREAIENDLESCTDLSENSRGWTGFEGEKEGGVYRASFAIKKISNITGKAEAAVPNYRDGTGVIYFTRETSSPYARKDDPSQLGSRKCDFNNVAN